MKQEDLIIELPHLQSLTQRLGSWFVSLACWSLWIYFLVPLVSLSGWLLGVRKFSAEVRWFGGYKSLIDLLQLYGLTILGILLIWTAWTLTRNFLRPQAPFTGGKGQQRDIPEALALKPESVREARAIRNLTVQFDEQGVITQTSSLESPRTIP
jgi:poly-beta-1,6-N-acetyl-D-glucosamine biosynthesis protein PgaD